LAEMQIGIGEVSRPDSRVGLTPMLLLSVLTAAAGGLLFGFDTAVISGATLALQRTFGLSAMTLGLTVSSALWGTILGAWGAGYAGQRFGRRDSLRVLAILYILSSVGCAVAANWTLLLVARMIGGLAIGGSSVLGPMYIAEVSPTRLRGRMVGAFQLNIVVGILVAYVSNYLISLRHLGAVEWRVQLAAPAVPSLIFFLLLLTIPRSPRWLIQVNRLQEAREALRRIGESDPDGELRRIAESVKEEVRTSGEKLFTRANRRPIFLATSVAIFSQLTGINAVLYYLNEIFTQAGASELSAGAAAVSVGVTNLIFTSLAMLIIDRFGRKILLLVGSLGMAATLSGIAIAFYEHSAASVLLWMVIGFCASFSFSIGAVIWVYISEVFPNGLRAKGQSLGSMAHWIMNAGVASLFPVLAAYAASLPFLFFAAMMVVQFFIVLLFYPETRNVTLEEMRNVIQT
jgi:SP family arabinose:H+ symporter-like MFS transporter